MFSFVSNLLETASLPPHGYCLLWRPDLIWMAVAADSAVAFSYFTIPVAMGCFVTKRPDLSFKWVFLLFGIFILLCGGTHVMEVVTFWQPVYGWETMVKLAAAIASVATAVVIWPLMPQALALPSAAELRRINALLEKEISQHKAAEEALRGANALLEERVAMRTEALTRLTEELQSEIAERALIEDGLRASTDLLHATFDAAPFPICVVRPDAAIMMWNKAAERDFGFLAQDIIGSGYQALYPDSCHTAADATFRKACAGDHLRGVQTSLRDRAGNVLPVGLSSAPVREADGRVRAVVYTLEDLRQRNAVEAQLRQAQKMEAIGNLTGGMAHDFNNLLAIIIGNLDSLGPRVTSDPLDGPPVTEAIDAALRGADLTRRLLAFARRQPLSPEFVDLSGTVGRSLALCRRLLGEAIAVEAMFEPGPLSVLVDPAQLEAAIVNLATNARDAMPRGGTLLVRTTRTRLDADYAREHADVQAGDYAMTEICDTGIGIDPAVMPRVFEPFFTTKEEGRGSGLGLAMVFGFIKQSGGHINVYSELGAGTCFRLYLPLAAGQADAAAGVPGAVATQTGHERILVVEDNERLRRIVVTQLASLGYRVAEAGNAAQALELLSSGAAVDLLFTDIVMAGQTNGLDLAHSAQQLAPDMRVVLTSGFPEVRAQARGWTGGTFKLLVKPYRKDELARTLRQVLDAA